MAGKFQWLPSLLPFGGRQAFAEATAAPSRMDRRRSLTSFTFSVGSQGQATRGALRAALESLSCCELGERKSRGPPWAMCLVGLVGLGHAPGGAGASPATRQASVARQGRVTGRQGLAAARASFRWAEASARLGGPFGFCLGPFGGGFSCFPRRSSASRPRLALACVELRHQVIQALVASWRLGDSPHTYTVPRICQGPGGEVTETPAVVTVEAHIDA